MVRDPETLKSIETAKAKLATLIEAQEQMKKAHADLKVHLSLMQKKNIDIDLYGDNFHASPFRLTDKIIERVTYWD